MKQNEKKNYDDDSLHFEKCSKRHCVVWLAQSFNLKNTDLKNVKVSEAFFVRFVQYSKV